MVSGKETEIRHFTESEAISWTDVTITEFLQFLKMF